VEFSVSGILGYLLDEDIEFRVVSEIVGFSVVPGDSDRFLSELGVVKFGDGLLGYLNKK
jgi:hypothetical protein